MALIDGQGCTFTFNGVLVGRITKFNSIDGVTNDVSHKPMGNPTIFSLPDVPDFGLLTLTIYRDMADVGQIALEDARANRVVGDCVWTLSNGSTRSFKGYVKKLPIVGDDNGLGTADAVIKIAGKLLSA